MRGVNTIVVFSFNDNFRSQTKLEFSNEESSLSEYMHIAHIVAAIRTVRKCELFSTQLRYVSKSKCEKGIRGHSRMRPDTLFFVYSLNGEISLYL